MTRFPRYRTGDPELDDRIGELIAHVGDVLDGDLVFEIIVSAVRLARDRASRGDLKIANAALKEMRYAFAVFEPYRAARKAAIFGSARTRRDDPLYEQTVSLARGLADADWMVITGAGPGIMEAGIEGAGAANSFGVSIRLPFEGVTTQFLADDPKLVNFRYFFTRKVIFVKEAHGFVLLPGGFGTLDEGFELLTLIQTGKAPPAPIVLLDVPGGTFWASLMQFVQRELHGRGYISPEDVSLVTITDDVAVALDVLTGFYRNYHSLRFVEGDLVLRMQRLPPAGAIAVLNRDFADLVVRGAIEPVAASKAEEIDNDVPELARLRFRFDRHAYSRLYELIDRLNEHQLPGADVLAIQAETRFVLDARGRVVRETDPDRRRGPCMRLAGHGDRNIVHLRDDVDDEIARAVEALVAREPPFVDPNVEPRHLGEYARLLGTTECSFERGYVFPRDFRYAHDVELVTSDMPFDRSLPQHFLSIKFTTVSELWRPWCISLVGGEIASIVETVRTGPRGVECGVNTDPRFRRRGLAAATTAGWARLEARPGRWLFYSTDRTNIASQGVARRLGLTYVGAGVALG